MKLNGIVAAAALVLLFAGTAMADEAIALKDGSMLLGKVTAVAEDTVTVQTSFPKEETRTLARKDLTDSSLWRILSGRLKADDGEGYLALGRWAESRQLFIAAVAEYRRAAKTDALRKEALALLAQVEGKLAVELFDRGEELLLAGKPGAALSYFTTLKARYPESEAAPLAELRIAVARRMIREATKADKAAAKAGSPMDAATWQRRVGAINKSLKAAAKYEQTAVHGQHSVRQVTALRKAIGYLERAWEQTQELGTPPPAIADGEVVTLRETVRQKLLKAYLDTGTAYLLRRALSQAEDYCTKACELDPGNATSHGLHRRIIEARLASDWGISSHGRFAGRGTSGR